MFHKTIKIDDIGLQFEFYDSFFDAGKMQDMGIVLPQITKYDKRK